MIDKKIIANNIKNVLKSTNLDIKNKYTGKVRDMYFTDDKSILISTDRQSAFDRSLGFIPFKGQILAQSSVWWFKETAHIVKNHFIASPDPNVVIARKAKVLPIEFVVRGYITGSTSTSLWTHYKNGSRDYCGNILPEGLVKNQKLPQNILTPTTKEQDHDRPISAQDIVKEGWLTQEQWNFASQKALELFEFGQQKALEHGLILADTKYEFGVDEQTGEIILIDEIHTPDSSRFWLKDSYVERFENGAEPENIDKEFFRLWFAKNCDPYNDKVLPEAPEELVIELSKKYITLFEMITGQKFELPRDLENIEKRIAENVTNYLNTEKQMNILLVGSGSREHAIAEAIKRSSVDNNLFCISGAVNPGIDKIAKDYNIADICDCDAVLKYAKSQNINIAIIGPEAPLEAGLADTLKEQGIGVVGPTKKLAQLETSKGFTRDLIHDYKIGANPFFKKFNSMEGVKETLKKYEKQFVIKTDGLCGGKGVLVWGDHLHSMSEAVKHCQSLVDAGKEFVIEEKLVGQEFSLISFTDGKNFIHMPAVQDHKRAYEEDKGPNTGGMGTYSDANHSLPFLSEEDIQKAKDINEKVVQALFEKFGEPYQGILYGGFMATKNDTKVIEYNARFGDPEAMNLLTLLETDFVEIIKVITEGTLDKIKPSFKNQASVCKYLVPLGYPNQSVKNFEIDISQCPDNVELFLGAVDYRDGKLIGTGSRAIAVLGLGDTISEAEQKAENAVKNIYGKLYHRPDIGTKGLINKRIRHMNLLRGNKYQEL
ncbi:MULTISPECIES: phosphoribosylaminoimidazolesuccinocarboxamide synthase [unclassified Francisella]|uniref:phosphoribosylaminoimidazolesuccinocarboxamide synthase n=1 Tax=unclassified Francisella TaxID=2610885 RepID=UPI002E36D08B|nr:MULTISPECIES: phosphoribosylaminoimidazolesuccinocarboxamide synthase [unclassified Francisella]MED7818687.1 phosphoribosylaminoimidazolesuccinocarboxamide synthase [Francisella sp. 19S2-4]MED7829596.1 phosphoribosylaminoimidazolesuccinocarboxamide synthase [Francisella sp. 19S2-10]